jgi:hypothetical protein
MRSLTLLSTLALLLLDACSPLYIPNAPHVPLFSEAGEARATVLMDPLASGFQGHLSWSPIRNLMLVGSGHVVPEQDSARGHRFLEAGIGGYLPVYSLRYRQPNGLLGLGSSPRDAYAVYITELIIGAGRGDARGITRGIFGPGEAATLVDYSRIYVQGTVGVMTRLERVTVRGAERQSDRDSIDPGEEFYDLGVAVKGFRVDFTRFERQGILRDTTIDPWFMQVALFGRYGREMIRGELQAGFSRSHLGLPFDWLEFFLAIGVQMKF